MRESLRALLLMEPSGWARLRDWLRDPSRLRWVWAALAIWTLAIGVRAIRKPEGAIARSHLFGQRFVAAVQAGGNLYGADDLHRPYPITFAMLFAPLSQLPLRLLRALWFAMQLGLVGAVAWMLADLAAEWYPHWEPNRWAVLGLCLLLVARFLQRDFSGGQVNFLVFALCLYTLWLVARGRGWIAGLPLGLAVAIKLTPLALTAYLAYRRHWRPALACLATAGLLFALPLPLLGPTAYAENVGHWFDGARTQAVADPFSDELPVRFDFGNQALRNMVHRYLRHYPGERPARGYRDVAALGFATADGVARAAAAALLIAVLLLFGKARPDPSTLPFFVECAIVLTLATLLSPITWKAHLVGLTLGLFLLLTYACCQHDRTCGRLLLGFFALCVALNRTTLGRLGEDLHQAYYLNTLAVLLLIGGLAHLLRRARVTHDHLVGLPPDPC